LKTFEYGDNEIGSKEVTLGIASMVIGFGILVLPRTIVSTTKSIDGLISIAFGGMLVLFFTWVLGKLTTQFPKQNLYDVVCLIINKKAATIITILFALYAMLFVSYEMRGTADISKLYLFDNTPIEVICFTFLLVVIYAVSGPSVVLLRLNLMFLPIVLLILAVLILLNINFFEVKNVRPFFVTEWSGIFKATKETVFSFLGFEIFLFYNMFMNEPNKMVKSVMIGISIPLLLYIIVFIIVIGVFSTDVTENLLYPTAELARLVEIPGGFFERFESLFFTIWVMTLFTTAAMAYDITLLALNAVFKKVKRMTLIFILSPIMFIIAMVPQNVLELAIFGELISYIGIGFGMFFPVLLLLIAKLRGVKGNG